MMGRRSFWSVLAAGLMVCAGRVWAEVPDCPDNVFVAGGFENPPVTAWEILSDTGGDVVLQNEAVARSGSGFAVLGGPMGASSLAQTVTLPQGAEVILSLWWVNPADSGNGEDVLLLAVDGEPVAELDRSDGNAGLAYGETVLDLSDFADGAKRTLSLVADILPGSATRWHLDDLCLSVTQPGPEGEGEGEGDAEGEGESDGEDEGESEGEGEASPEGETEGEGLPEGEDEGESEGLPETEGEACDVREIQIAFPEDGARIFTAGEVTTFRLGLGASVDCEEDTREVRFYGRSGTGAFGFLAASQTPPYQAAATLLEVPEEGRDFTIRAEALSRTRPAPEEQADGVIDEVEVRIRRGNDADTLGNGFPDAPFETLDRPGSTWLSEVTMPGAAAAMVANASALYAFTPGSAEPRQRRTVAVSLENPRNNNQRVTVSVSESLLNANEVGMLLVQAASDLTGLVGSEVASGFRREPTGRLGNSGFYISVAVLVTTANNPSFQLLNPNRLANNPIEVRFEGLGLGGEQEYVLASHQLNVQQSAAGMRIVPASGPWQTVPGASLDRAEGTAAANLTRLGVVAPYRIVDTDLPCEGIFCGPPEAGILYLILVALGILQLVDGGVGGGSPCFLATAAFGSTLAPELDVLRHFRDTWLLGNAPGTAFTDLYYRLSPPLADWVAASPVLAAAVRLLLVPVLLVAAQPGFAIPFAAILFLLVAGRRYRRAGSSARPTGEMGPWT